MKCPYCEYLDSKVVDSRPTDEGESIRRRRECLSCQRRFTTYEQIEMLPIVVIKKDGSRQAFDKQKILNGLLRASEKRPISLSDLTNVVNSIELKLQNELHREIKSTEIGELVMDELKRLDEVAYVRFASVYREFKDVNSFMAELTSLLGENVTEDS
ncbi:MAG: transcriptional repressor NrdR [Clostridiales bacterium]|jgi:transcriptional repressor NrdR|nr:transcriptional repressor NrdR [Clostridiales bacterium]